MAEVTAVSNELQIYCLPLLLSVYRLLSHLGNYPFERVWKLWSYGSNLDSYSPHRDN